MTSLGARQLDLCAIAEPLVPSPHPLLYGATAEPPRTARRGLPTKLAVHCSNKLVCSANWQCDHRWVCSVAKPMVHCANGLLHYAKLTVQFYYGTSGSLSEGSGSIAQIGGALYELDCSIMEPAVHSQNGTVL